MSTKPKRVRWFEPRWRSVPRTTNAWRDFLSSRSFPIIFAMGAVVWLIAAFLELKVNNPNFNWFLAFWVSVGSFVAYAAFCVACCLVVYLLVPPIIEVNKKGIVFSFGSSSALYPHESIKHVRLAFFHDRKISMRVITETGSRWYVGVSPRVDFYALRELVGEKLSVRDWRHRTIRDCGPENRHVCFVDTRSLQWQ